MKHVLSYFTLFCLLHNSMCSFIVLMPSVRIYNVNSRENKEKPLNEKMCPNFWLVVYILGCKTNSRRWFWQSEITSNFLTMFHGWGARTTRNSASFSVVDFWRIDMQFSSGKIICGLAFPGPNTNDLPQTILKRYTRYPVHGASGISRPIFCRLDQTGWFKDLFLFVLQVLYKNAIKLYCFQT